jgi:hypothetical protein
MITAKTKMTMNKSRFCESENATIMNSAATNPDMITKPLANKPAHENRFGENPISLIPNELAQRGFVPQRQ